MNDFEPYRKIIAAVIALSLRDAARPCRSASLTPTVSEAMDFLFLHSAGYLSVLDIDAEQFRKRLIDYAFDKQSRENCGHHLSDFERRCFRMNYKLWYDSAFWSELFPQTEAA